MGDPFDVKGASTPALFAAYRAILRELRDRRIVRTMNAPTGDYAEYLTLRALGGELAANSEKSYDLITPQGRRIQVKSRVADESGKDAPLQLSPFRTFDFDEACIVIFNSDYSVRRAVLVPAQRLEASSRFSKHVNGHLVQARTSLLDLEGNIDVTESLRAAAGEH